jgi:hypothetical protein
MQTKITKNLIKPGHHHPCPTLSLSLSLPPPPPPQATITIKIQSCVIIKSSNSPLKSNSYRVVHHQTQVVSSKPNIVDDRDAREIDRP